jgi:RNA-binding protein
MTDEDRQRRIHELDVTLRVGKGGVEQVADELADQVADRGLVEVKFLRAARGGTTTDELAAELASLAGVSLVRTRGHTAVYEG